MSNELQRQERSKELALQYVKDLPFHVGTEPLKDARRHLWLAFGRGSPDLFKCSDQSIAYAIALSAMSGLYPGGPRPDVWLIPRFNSKNKCLECNWQISSRGYQRMAADAHYRTRAYVVHEHDLFKVVQGSSPAILHEPAMDVAGTWATIQCAYITVIDTEGRMEFAILRKDQLKKRRAKAQRDNVWAEWPEEQTLKTMHAYAGAREMWPTEGASRFAMAADQLSVQSSPSAPDQALTAGDFEPQTADGTEDVVDPGTIELDKDSYTSPRSDPQPPGEGLIEKDQCEQLVKAIRDAGQLEAAIQDYRHPKNWRVMDLDDLELYTVTKEP